MKSILMITLLTVAQLVSAQVKKVEPLTREQARSHVSKSKIYETVEKVKKSGGRIIEDPVLKEQVKKTIETTLKSTKKLTAIEANSLVLLLDVNPKETLAEIARIASISNSPEASAVNKANAKKSLDLIVKGSRTFETLTKGGKVSSAQVEAVKNLVEVSEKVASFDFNAQAKDFKTRFEDALLEGKSVEEAITKASDKKISLKDVLNCV